jgi:hypothetical protein
MISRGPNIVFRLPVKGRRGGAYLSNDAIPVLHPGHMLRAPSPTVLSARAGFESALGATSPVVLSHAVIAAALSMSN